MERNEKTCNATLDISKLFFAYLVVGIHTEVFGFNGWLDKGFGMITRVCVPFFFVASSYFFFSKNGNPIQYVKRLFLLYAVWSVMYLPFDIANLRGKTVLQLLKMFLWSGNEHALWYLWCSIIGFLITYGLSKRLSKKNVLMIGIIFLLIGCIKSTYAPVWDALLSVQLPDVLGSRNGLFYAFPYYALGMVIARGGAATQPRVKHAVIGLLGCLVLLSVETVIMVMVFKTEHTNLWISVFPMTYYLFVLLQQITIPLPYAVATTFRRLSTMIYVCHSLFRPLFSFLDSWKFFLAVSVMATALSLLIVLLSNLRFCKWLKYLY